ncbi:hypothetical protein AAF712_009011 [Marasmius tenuissimus]|uniref:Uncharacterized protein n=1 Tax=Marasmius tenuissimus TaxID=585030 RepID=A0ABR2ZRV3_9AGAR
MATHNSFSGAHNFEIHGGDFSSVQGNKSTNIYHRRKTDIHGHYKSQVNQNHYGDNFRESNVGSTSRDIYTDGARSAPPGDMSSMGSPNHIYPQYQGNPVPTQTLINRNHHGDNFQNSSVNSTSRNVYNGYVPSHNPAAGTGYDIRHHHQNAAYRYHNVDPHHRVHSEPPPASGPPHNNPNRQRHYQEHATSPPLYGANTPDELSEDRSQAYSRNPFVNQSRQPTSSTLYPTGPHSSSQSLPAHGWSSSTAPSINAEETVPESWGFEDAYPEEDEAEDLVATDPPPARFRHTPQAFTRGANEGW